MNPKKLIFSKDAPCESLSARDEAVTRNDKPQDFT